MPALPPLGLDIDRCITKTLQKSKMAKMLYVINVMLHENASVKKIKNEQVIFLCLIKLDSLKCYYDQKITFIFSSDFETMFIKHSPSEIISLNFEKKTVNLNCNFPV